MNSPDEQWLHRTAWRERAAYQTASRNGAVAFWVGVLILVGLFYVSVISAVVDVMN